jgi:3-hydroxybutyryl-CoA dehydrogenase
MHVRDQGIDKSNLLARGYQHRAHLDYHTDSPDVVALLCVLPAMRGGVSTIVSSVSVHDEILRRRPDLAAVLYEPWWHDRRRGDGPDSFFQCPIYATNEQGKLFAYYGPDYVRSASRGEGVPELTEMQIEAMELLEGLNNDPRFVLNMNFQPGDVQFLNNYVIMHGRTEYEDYPDPSRKRDLIRLWLTVDRDAARPLERLEGAEHSESLEGAETVERVGIVGCGLMGSGIAEVCARAGVDVVVREVDSHALAAGRERIERSLARAAASGKISEEARSEALGRIALTTSLEDLAASQLVVEAVTEDEEAKLEVFRALDKILQEPRVVMASNTSSIPIMKLAVATSRPDRVVGIHFFNPVPVLRLVELVCSLVTSEETAAAARTFAADRLGKKVITSQDRAGFIVNALLIPYILSAIRMFESGFATAEDIDTGMVEGCAHPMGPLALADLVGLDTTMAVAQSMYEEFKEPLYAPPPLLARMVDAGLLGRKAGRGFYPHGRRDKPPR